MAGRRGHLVARDLEVIAADLPLGVVVPGGRVQESIAIADDGAPLSRELELARVLKAFTDAGVRNVVWVTADVHCCAAHHCSPERAAFTDFDEFWEFVAGPINAGSFGPNELDGTFGPEQIVLTGNLVPLAPWLDRAGSGEEPARVPRGAPPGRHEFGELDGMSLQTSLSTYSGCDPDH